MATKLLMKLPNAFLYAKLKSFRGVHIQLLAKVAVEDRLSQILAVL